MKHILLKMISIATAVMTSAIADETFNGVGIAILPAEKGAEVVNVIPGTPAADSKLQKGDLIISVNGNSTFCKKMEDVLDMLRGEVNKPVEIVFINNGDTLETTVRRAELVVKNFNSEGYSRSELESYASAAQSDRKLVAIMNQGDVVNDNKVSPKAKSLDCIYVEKNRIKESIPNNQEFKRDEKDSIKSVSRTSVGFELKSAGKAVITIMDADGAVAATLISENARPGYNSLRWNSENVPSGRYMVTIEHNGSVSGKNVVLK